MSTSIMVTQTLTGYDYASEYYHQRSVPLAPASHGCTYADADVRRAMETGITSFTSDIYVLRRPFSRTEQYTIHVTLVVERGAKLNDSTRSIHRLGAFTEANRRPDRIPRLPGKPPRSETTTVYGPYFRHLKAHSPRLSSRE